MKTITFYSYKGGVGRSLALANIATRLAEFGKKVCIIDFDLEAPGMPVKFEKEIKQPIKNGIVDYIYEYANKGILPDKIIDYSIPFELKGNRDITLIPAGNIESEDYWRKLSSIDWFNLVYQNPNSISFFIDLKQKIKRELAPDFLLIDSRTGISEMSGITISLLADDIVIVSANNRENLMGSKRIIENLSNPDKAILGKVPKITFVLSRIPFSDIPVERGREQILVAKIKKEIPLPNLDSFYVLHSDRELEEDETIKISNPLEEISKDTGKANNSIQITNDYLLLFGHITEGLLDKNGEEKIIDINKSTALFNQAMRTKKNSDRIALLDQAIKLNPFNASAIAARGDLKIEEKDFEGGITDYESILQFDFQFAEEIYILIGLAYCKQEQYEKALVVFNNIIKLNGKKIAFGFYEIGGVYCQGKMKDFGKAIEYFTKAIEYNYPDLSLAYNGRANAFRELDEYDKAFEDIFKALELDPEKAVAYLTLAETYAATDKANEFYLNLEIGLSKDAAAVADCLPKERIYSKFLKDERFINLLDKYNIPIPSYDVLEPEPSFIAKAKEIKRKNELVAARERFLTTPGNFELAEKEVVNIISIIKTKVKQLEDQKIYFGQEYIESFPQHFILQSEHFGFSIDWGIGGFDGYVNDFKILKDAKLTVKLCHGTITWDEGTMIIKQGSMMHTYAYTFDIDPQKKTGWKLPNNKNFYSNEMIVDQCITWLLDMIDQSLPV